MSNEDKMAMKLADMENRDFYDRVNVDYEKHYNHYGSRGVADLYVQQYADDWREDTVYEIKADAAIKEATGANEIVRQFNKMCKYFYAGVEDSYPPRGSTTPRAELTFVASDLVFKHIQENYQIYQSIQNETVDSITGNIETGVGVRSLGEETAPFILFNDEIGLEGNPLECNQNVRILEEADVDKSVVGL